MVATFGALVRHPAVVPTLEDGRLVAVTAQSVHHDMAAALTVVRVGDRLAICVPLRLTENPGVARGPGVITHGACGAVIGNLDTPIVRPPVHQIGSNTLT